MCSRAQQPAGRGPPGCHNAARHRAKMALNATAARMPAAHARVRVQSARTPRAAPPARRPTQALPAALRHTLRAACARSVAPTAVAQASPNGLDVVRTRKPTSALPCAAVCAAAAAALFALTPGAASAAGALVTPDAGLVPYLVSFILHLDKHLSSIVAQHGARTYALLFAIVFAETVRAASAAPALALSVARCPLRLRCPLRVAPVRNSSPSGAHVVHASTVAPGAGDHALPAGRFAAVCGGGNRRHGSAEPAAAGRAALHCRRAGRHAQLRRRCARPSSRDAHPTDRNRR